MDSKKINKISLNSNTAASWSKHRPKDAGPIAGNRPAFGTVLFSAPKFANPVHAARYATKYLIKTPDHGFPVWVLKMGKERRIRRYSTSRGFWETPSQRQENSDSTRKNRKRTYAERIEECGDSVNLFEIVESFDPDTGEILPARNWRGQLDVKASDVLDNLFDPGNPERNRRSLLARNTQEALKIICNASGKDVDFIRKSKPTIGGSCNE